MSSTPRGAMLLVLAGWILLACDRNLEPFDPAEEPRPPDLAKLFPPGAEQAAAQTPGQAPAMPERGAPPVSTEAEPVRGTLRVAPELADRVPSGGILFLIARSGEAGPPLAVKRIPDPRFPLDFELGPDDRMIQQIPFAGPLRLTARVDADGNASTRQPGDLVGVRVEPVEPGATGVEILLDEVL